jgi:crotonobetainyl-CoA:carnitine CoA-transferase CaiB-like acyl-CoA transferase
LARASDFDLLPAWLGAPLDGRDPWTAIADWIRLRGADDVVDHGQLLGLPVARARLAETAANPTPWEITSYRAGSPVERRPLVIDLSSLWAGPLCAGLLASAGARVIKIESRARPDGARRGPPEFFDLLNAGKESVALDLAAASGQQQLRLLVDAADVVIESARPRVMRQWGFDVDRIVADRTDLVWVSITGYGRSGPRSNWVAFGDDAAAAGGLLAVGPDSAPRFCGDAAADPATGLHAAAAALAGLAAGGSHLIDIALSKVAAFVAGTAKSQYIDATGTVPSPPRARVTNGRGPQLGQDTERVLAELPSADH